jgi:hypothetical protein
VQNFKYVDFLRRELSKDYDRMRNRIWVLFVF